MVSSRSIRCGLALLGLLGAAALEAAPSVEVSPLRILDSAERAVVIAVQFPEGFASITGVTATYNGLSITEILIPFVTELTDTSGTIEIPPISFPPGSEARFEFRIDTTAGSASDVLRISVPPAGVVHGYAVRSDFDDQLYRIDLNSGAAVAIGPLGSPDVEGLSFDAQGVLYGVDDDTNQLITVDLDSGGRTVIGPLGVDADDMGLAFTADGQLWMTTDDPAHRLYRVDPHSGNATLIRALTQEVKGLAAMGQLLYGMDLEDAARLITIDPASGTVSIVGPLATLAVDDGGLDFEAGGTLWGVEDGGDLFTLDLATGRASPIATTLGGFESLAVHPPVAPVRRASRAPAAETAALPPSE